MPSGDAETTTPSGHVEGSDGPLGLSVTLRVAENQTSRFLSAIAANQQAALEKEAGCLAFLVGRDLEETNVFHLFEVYGSREALDEHRRSAHFQRWRTEAAEVLEPGGIESALSQLVLDAEIAGNVSSEWSQ